MIRDVAIAAAIEKVTLTGLRHGLLRNAGGYTVARSGMTDSVTVVDIFPASIAILCQSCDCKAEVTLRDHESMTYNAFCGRHAAALVSDISDGYSWEEVSR